MITLTGWSLRMPSGPRVAQMSTLCIMNERSFVQSCKTERFALPLTAAPQFEAQWYRVTYELTAGTAKTDPGRRS